MKDISILVVDNEEEILASYKQSLEEFGKKFRHKVDIKVTRSVLDALRIIRHHRVDAVFLDYHFDAGMNGDEFIDLLPEHLNNLYIVLISSREKEELERIVTRRHIQLDQQNFPFRFLSKSTSDNFNLQLQDVYQNIISFLDRQPLPSLLAYTARTIDESDNSLAKLSAMKDFLETTMKYLASILVADAFHRRPRKLLQRQINRNVGYGFGVWLGWLRELLDQEKISAINDFVPEIWEALFEPLSDQQTPFGFLNSFKDIRDQKLGHGFVNEEVYYKSLVEELSNPFTQFRERLHFCTRYHLIAVEGINFDESDSDKFKYRIRTLMGLDLRPATKELRTKLRLQKNNVYLVDSFGQFLLLHPFVSFELCPRCDSRRVFMMDTTRGDNLFHIALCNHRRESKPDFKVLQKLITPQAGTHIEKEYQNLDDIQADLSGLSLLGLEAINNQSLLSNTDDIQSMNVSDEVPLQGKTVVHSERNQVFISYSHKDKKWLQELKTMLTPLIHKQTVLAWDDSKIEAGSEWSKEIESALNSARVAVLMVSPNFLASEFIAKRELPQLLKAAQEGGLTVLWVHVSHSMYKETEIEIYQAAHDPSQPLSSLSKAKRDQTLVKICEKIQKAFNA